MLQFWFGEALVSPAALGERVGVWFGGGPDFDARVRSRFAGAPERAAKGEFDAWREEARASLALVLLLDQLPRNLHRGEPQAFAFDAHALACANEALKRGFDTELHPVEAAFLYLPLEHAEDAGCQARCVALFRALVERASPASRPHFESFLSFAVRHREVIDRFGRFPHRNALLGRISTPAEAAYLAEGGETFGGDDPS